MPTEVQNDNMQSQTDSNDSSEPMKNDNNMLNDLLSSILSQSVRTRKTKDSKVEKNDNEENDSEENDSEENDSEENDSEENELISDENDLRWVALSKLLDSHLCITKSFLHLVREE
jgi:hypothetical protein